MNIKHILSTLAILAFLGGATQVSAQQKQGHRKEMAEQKFKELSTYLHLTAGQESEMKEILMQTRTEMKKMRDGKEYGSPEDRKDAMRELRQRTNERINAMLDSNQQQLYKQFKEKKRAQHQGKAHDKKVDRAKPEQLEMDDEGLL